MVQPDELAIAYACEAHYERNLDHARAEVAEWENLLHVARQKIKQLEGDAVILPGETP